MDADDKALLLSTADSKFEVDTDAIYKAPHSGTNGGTTSTSMNGGAKGEPAYINKHTESTALIGSGGGGGGEGVTAEPPANLGRTMAIIYLTIFVGSVMYTIPLPSLPQYVDQVHAPTTYLGYLVSAFSLGQFVASPFLGAWFNARGAGQPLIFAGIVLVIGNVFYGTAPNKILLVISRFIIGVGAGNVSVCRAYAAMITPEDKRTGIFALIAAAQGVGFVVGPALGSSMSTIDFRYTIGGHDFLVNDATAPGYLSALLCLVNVALIVVFFEGKLPPQAPAREGVDEDGYAATQKACGCIEVDGSLDLIAVFASMFIFFLIIVDFSIFETILAQMAKDLFDWSTLRSGIMFMGAGVVSIISFLSVKPLNKFLSDRNLLLLGLTILFGAAAVCINLDMSEAVSLARFLSATALISIGYPIASALAYAVFSKILGSTAQGTMMGWLTSAGSTARMLGPIAAAWGYTYYGTFAVFCLIGGVTAVAIFSVLVAYRKLRSHSELREVRAKNKSLQYGSIS